MPSLRPMDHGAPRRRIVPIVGAVIVVLLIGAAAFWFVNRDDDKNDEPGDKASNTPLAEQTFAVSGVPFTFVYPGNFAPAEAPQDIIWVAGISPVDIIDVKRISDKEIGPVKLKSLVRSTLEDTAGVTISAEGTAKAGTTDLVTFVVDNTASGTPLRSDLYYFVADGSTWQFECQSQADNRATIDSACSRAIDTLSIG